MAALAKAVQNSTKTGQTITWTHTGGTAYDITGATLSARMRNRSTGIEQTVTGTLTIVTAASGIFSWTYSAADVATAGTFDVQFKADYGASGYDLSIPEIMTIEEAI